MNFRGCFCYKIAKFVAEKLLEMGVVRDSTVPQVLHNYFSHILQYESIINRSDNYLSQLYTYNSRTGLLTGYFYPIPESMNPVNVSYIVQSMSLTQNYQVKTLITGGLTQSRRISKILNDEKIIYLPCIAGQGVGTSNKGKYKK